MDEGEYFCSTKNLCEMEGRVVEKCSEEFFTPKSGGSFMFNKCSLSNYDLKIKKNLDSVTKNPLFDWYEVENRNYLIGNKISGQHLSDAGEKYALIRGGCEKMFGSGVKKAKSFSANEATHKQLVLKSISAYNRAARSKSNNYTNNLMEQANKDIQKNKENVRVADESDFLAKDKNVKEYARRSHSEGSLTEAVLVETQKSNVQMIADTSIKPRRRRDLAKENSLHTSFSHASILDSYKDWRGRMQEKNKNLKSIFRQQSNITTINRKEAFYSTEINTTVAPNLTLKKKLKDKLARFFNVKKKNKNDETVATTTNQTTMSIILGHSKINDTVRKIKIYHDENTRENQLRKLVTDSANEVCTSTVNSNIPPFIVECIGQIEKRGVNSSGIYRVSGNKTHIEKIIEAFHAKKGAENVDSSFEYNVHAYCGALKQYLRMLPVPVIPKSSFDILKKVYLNNVRSFADVRDVSGFRKDLHGMFFGCLSKCQFETLKLVLHHLHKVSTCEKENKMNCNNLAVCFWLCLIEREEDSKILVPMYNDYLSFTIEAMIAHYPFIFEETAPETNS